MFMAVHRLYPPHVELLRRLRASFAGTLVVIATIPSHTAVLDVIRAGANDFIDLAGDLRGELASVVTRLRNEPSRSASARRLFTVAPSADASDANLMAANLAASMARQQGRCELLDLHLRGGDLAAMFGLTPRHTLGDLLNQGGTVDGAMYEQAITAHASGVRLMAGPRLFASFHAGAQALERIISLARTGGGCVVLNVPDVELADALRVLTESTRIVLTTRLDLVSLMRAKETLAWMTERGAARTAILVVPMGVGRRGEAPAKDVQRVLGEFALACVPDDPFAQMVSINMGEPMILGAPRSEASQAIERIASALFNGDSAAAPPRARRFALPRWRSANAAAPSIRSLKA
jgi:Flp pilus assembly CpaE family ATPase